MIVNFEMNPATATEEMGWDYEEIDVSEFLRQEFTPGCRVDFLPVDQELGTEWRRGTRIYSWERFPLFC